MHRTLALSCLAISCGTPSATPAPTHPFEGDHFAVSFPAPPRARRAHEGPLASALIASAVDAERCRHEAAVFDFPRALDADERRRLLSEVERGLGARQGARGVESRTLKSGARELVIALDGDAAGHWRVFYVGAERMVQLSVVCPNDAAVAQKSRAFFASYRGR
jgi:hypothetical protein